MRDGDMRKPVPRDLLIFLHRNVFLAVPTDILESFLLCSTIVHLDKSEKLDKPGLYVVYSGRIRSGSFEYEAGDYVYTERGVEAVSESVLIYSEPECAQLILSVLNDEETCQVNDLIMRPPVKVRPNTSVVEAVRLMHREGVSSVIIVNENDKPLGIFTDTDLRRLVAEGADLSRPIREVMTPNPITVKPYATCTEAAYIMMKENIKHLVIEESGRVKGVITVRDVAYAEALGPLYVLRRVRVAESVDALAAEYRRLLRLLKREGARIKPGTGRAVDLVRMASLATRELISRVVQFAVSQASIDCNISYIVMGSNARLEQFLITDRDTMLIYHGCGETSARRLAERIEDMLDRVGVPGCPHGYTSRRLVYHVDELGDLITSLFSKPTGENLILLSMFYDSVAAYGESKYTNVIRERIARHAIRHGAYLREALTIYRPKLGVAGRLPSEINLKAHGLAPIVYSVKALSLAHGLWAEVNTLDRIRALVSRKVLPPDLASDVVEAYHTVMSFIVWFQAVRGEIRVEKDALTGFERQLLRDALRVVQRFVEYVRGAGL